MADHIPPRAPSDPRTRVLHLVINLDVGGLERVVLNHVRYADRSRFDVGVICLGAEGRLASDVRALDAPVQALGVHGPRIGTATRRLVAELRRSKPDVLHTHDLAPHLLGSPAARLARVPVVVHTRHCQTGGLTLRQALGLRVASALSSVIVAVSEDSARRLRRSEGVTRSRCRVIHNGVDVAAFSPGDRWTRPPGRRAISVGRLAAVKDYPALLRAARRVLAALPDFQLQLVGDGPERAALESLRAALGLETCVSFLGERHDIPQLLAAADVFALASSSEGLSISLLEALASGLPIVATRVGGNPEIVASGAIGILVRPRDDDALATALISLLNDPARLTSMAHAARLHAEEHFDLRHVVARYETVYVERLAATSRSSPSSANPR